MPSCLFSLIRIRGVIFIVKAIGSSLMDYLSDRDSFQLDQSLADDDRVDNSEETGRIKMEPVLVHYLPSESFS